MIQNLIVALMVLGSLAYAGRKLRQWLSRDSGCGSGCGSCNACDTAPTAAPGGRRVIKLHVSK